MEIYLRKYIIQEDNRHWCSHCGKRLNKNDEVVIIEVMSSSNTSNRQSRFIKLEHFLEWLKDSSRNIMTFTYPENLVCSTGN